MFLLSASDSESILVYASVIAGAIVISSYLRDHVFLRKPPLPPGPKGYPIIGSFFNFPQRRPWFEFAKYKQAYGPISSVSLLGQVLIIINDKETAVELLERRSSNYSERPRAVFAYMAGMGNLLPLVHYGPEHREQRKVIRQSYGSTSYMHRLLPLVESEARHFLIRLLARENPKHLLSQLLRSYAGATILSTSYGYSIQRTGGDPLIHEAQEMVETLLPGLKPAAWLVDTIPWLKYLPDWMPGSGYKRTARHMRKICHDFAERPFLFVKAQMACGKARPSFISSLLEKSSSEDEEHYIKWAGASMYAGGQDTILSVSSGFFLAMTLFPEIQKRAQDEIDAVVGRDRLPTISDRENLPYVSAVVKEAFRWHVAAPLCIPHVASENDKYNGYFIPKGAIILPNIWQFTHDPESHPDPLMFKPERFLGPEPEGDPTDTVFGFGRRCPGRKHAESSVFIVAAMSLAVLNINKALDENGLKLTPTYEMTDGTLVHPMSFKCSTSPRHSKVHLLLATGTTEEPDSSDVDVLRTIVL